MSLTVPYSAKAIVLAISVLQVTAQAQFPDDTQGGSSRGPWSWSVGGAAARQFAADLDGGGEFSINRLFIEPSVRYTSGRSASVAFTVGYGYDGYDFSGSTSPSPWGDIHSWRLSTPMHLRLNDRWTLFGIPTLRSTAESGADFSDSVTGGALVGFSYKFSESLRLGPGLGVLTQIEDGTAFFPFLAINWKITNTLSLRTGSGLAATLDPGLTLAWRPERQWELAVTGRRNRIRFRLDNSGLAPGGVGENRSFDIVGSIGYEISRGTSLSLFGGLSLRGELRLEDTNGVGISDTDYDPAAMMGVTFKARF